MSISSTDLLCHNKLTKYEDNQYLELWELIYTVLAFLMVNCMLLFRGRQTREMSSLLQPMVPTEPKILYFRNYLVCAKIFLGFANQL